MRLIQRPLLPVLLLLLSFAGGLGLARSSAMMKDSSPARAGCVEDCKEKQDKMLERCEQIPEARRENCREAANTAYNKCVERCGDRSR